MRKKEISLSLSLLFQYIILYMHNNNILCHENRIKLVKFPIPVFYREIYNYVIVFRKLISQYT